MDESIQVESQSYRDPRYRFFIIVHLHEMDVAASVSESGHVSLYQLYSGMFCTEQSAVSLSSVKNQ